MSNVSHRLTGMKSVNPYLIVENVHKLIAFIQTVFDGTLKFKLDRPDGSIMHAEIIIGDSIIMAGEPTEEFGEMPASLYIYVEECDKLYEKAIQNGAKSIMVPTNMKHAGERYGGVKDFAGNIWWIATRIENLTPEEQAKRIQA